MQNWARREHGITLRSLRGSSLPQVVGDDLLVTNPKRVKDAIAGKWCNALLLKVNQIGSVTESIEVRPPHILGPVEQGQAVPLDDAAPRSLTACLRRRWSNVTGSVVLYASVCTGGADGQGGGVGRHGVAPLRRDRGLFHRRSGGRAVHRPDQDGRAVQVRRVFIPSSSMVHYVMKHA